MSHPRGSHPDDRVCGRCDDQIAARETLVLTPRGRQAFELALLLGIVAGLWVLLWML